MQVRPEGHAPQRWAITESSYSVGRHVGQKIEGHFSVSGDPTMSRHHFDIERAPGGLRIRRHHKARNPIFFKGEEKDDFVLIAGDVFITGKTRFTLSDQSPSSYLPTTEYTLLRSQLQELQEENSGTSFRTMLELLPKLRESVGGKSAFQSALEVLDGLLPQAGELKALKVGENIRPVIEICKSDGVTTPASRGLVTTALEQRATVAHVWALAAETELKATAHARADWAIASPVAINDDESYCLYAMGKSGVALSETEIRKQKRSLDEIAALLDIVAETLKYHLASERMNRFEGQVGQFFSPGLRERLTDRGFHQILEPKLREVTVMFFDLRGFSKATESAEDEALEKILLHHEVLTGVMTEVTEAVFSQGGLVIDYQGDAVMACWGALSEGAEVNSAVTAALAIVEKIHKLELPFGGQKLACGIGLATGKVVAGQIGAREQIKFGVLGKSVNLASRLEGLTKYFGVPILVNQALQEQLDPTVNCRRVGKVRPAGLTEAVCLHEVVLPCELGGSGFPCAAKPDFERSLEHFEAGDLELAVKQWESESLSADPVAKFLVKHSGSVLKRGVPPEWTGAIEFFKK